MQERDDCGELVHISGGEWVFSGVMLKYL
jgi:hypothetical protein